MRKVLNLSLLVLGLVQVVMDVGLVLKRGVMVRMLSDEGNIVAKKMLTQCCFNRMSLVALTFFGAFF